MRRTIQKQQWSLDNRNEDKAWDEWYIGDGANVPGTRRAILMIAEGPVVLVMVDNAENERHAQIQQANHDCQYAGFRHAELEFGVSCRESQAWFGNRLPTLRSQQNEEDHSRGQQDHKRGDENHQPAVGFHAAFFNATVDDVIAPECEKSEDCAQGHHRHAHNYRFVNRRQCRCLSPQRLGLVDPNGESADHEPGADDGDTGSDPGQKGALVGEILRCPFLFGDPSVWLRFEI